MPAPLAKGIIVAASILVAAGIAFYENEAIREWIDSYRQKIAIALHSLGDEISPDYSSRQPESSNREGGEGEGEDQREAQAQRRRRRQIIRRNQLELVRRAREEGVAVDLDELAAVAREYDDRPDTLRRDRSRTFDELVGSDGTLRMIDNDATAASTTATASAGEDGLRQRGAGARGFASGSSFANPFDDAAEALFDQELIRVHDEGAWAEEAMQKSRESTRTLEAEPLIDVSEHEDIPQPSYKTDDELEAEIAEAIRRSLEDSPSDAMVIDDTPVLPIGEHMEMAQTQPDPPISIPGSVYESYYYGPHPSTLQQQEQQFILQQAPQVTSPSMSFHSATAQPEELTPMDFAVDIHDDGDDGAHTPAGTMTPTEDGFSTAASLAGSGADDVGVISEMGSLADGQEHEHGHDHDHDAQSEAGFSEAYSLVGGASTPGSWTDVESVDGEEDEQPAAARNGMQGQQPHIHQS